MEVLKSSLSGVSLLRVTGEVDHSTAPALLEAIDAARNEEDPRLLIDLTGCVYLDSGGLGVMLTAFDGLRERGWLGVIGPSKHVRRLLGVIGLVQEEGFFVFDSEEEAAAFVAAGERGSGGSPASPSSPAGPPI